jgi:hypothetical protein
MFTERTEGPSRSGIMTALKLRASSKKAEEKRSKPPPLSRHAPTRAGRQAMDRYIMAPLACFSMAIWVRMVAGRVVA